MTKLLKEKKFKIIISVGDETGIGPEIILKALASNELIVNDNVIIVGSKDNLIKQYKSLKSLGIENLIDPEHLNIEDPTISSFYKKVDLSNSGNASFYYLKHATQIVKSLPHASLVTGPICKKSWSLSGHNYSGQTEFLAEACDVKEVGMLFTAKSPITGWRFNTLLATTHIPLEKVPRCLNNDLIFAKLDLLLNFCKKFNKNPSLKVAGLNPHAGEEGVLGKEESSWIEETLRNWASLNPDVKLKGPISPDSCWISAAKAWKEKIPEENDGILAMYHDQGLIPVKVIASNYSVNTTIGLPFIRTSPDHGTGFDIAGKGIAQCQSMIEAIKTAAELSNNL